MKREGSLRDYLDAAGERFQEAKDLYRLGRFGGATYLAGVSVECALNAFLPSGHRIRGTHTLGLLAAEGLSQRLAPRRAKDVGTILTELSLRWSNSQRYYPGVLIERLVKPNVKSYRDAKGNAKYVIDAAYELFAEANAVWIDPDDLERAQRWK
jgi:HEPN domain-containing protein